MKHQILVLGAGGYIGRRLIDSLIGAHADWAVPLAAYRRAASTLPGSEAIQLDATDHQALSQAMANVDAVVNCVAGSAKTIAASGKILFDVASAQTKRPRIIHLSTMSVYGSARGQIDEAAELKGDLGDYSSAKVDVERHAAAYPAAIVLRPGCVYGPGSPQWSLRIGRWLEARRIGDLGAAGDGWCNLVHVDDVVAAILHAIRSEGLEGQAFNLGMPSPPTWNEYFVGYGIALGAVPVQRISGRALKFETKLLAPPLKIAERLLGVAGVKPSWLPEAIPPSLLRLWQQDIQLKVEKAEQLLEMKWTPLDEGLRQTAGQFPTRRH